MSKIKRTSILMFFVFFLISDLLWAAEYCSKTIDPSQLQSGFFSKSEDCGQCPTVKLSCDFSAKSKLPEVVLLGDQHAGSALSRQYRFQLLSLAVNGLFPVASEGLIGHAFLPWYKPTNLHMTKDLGASVSAAHGIESPVAHAVQMSYYIQNAMVLSDQPRVSALLLKEIKAQIIALPLFREAFSRLKAKQAVEPDLEMQSLIQEVESEISVFPIPEQQLVPPRLKTPTKAEIAKEVRPVELFATQLHLNLLEIVNDPMGPYFCFFGSRRLHPLVSVKDRSVVGIDPDSKGWVDGVFQKYDFYRVQIKVRDREFARAAAELICEYADTYKGMFVIVGEEHQSAEFNSWLKLFTEGRLKRIEVLKSSDPSHSAEIDRFMTKFNAASFKP